eukprot:gene29234-35289_t
MAAANNRGNSIEFIVMPKENLYLEGGVRKLPRVAQGEAYPCQMQKAQNFSCLFRHYAKHNGLKKEDLVFTFVDELLPDQTPESVHLMQSDEIFVEHRKPSEQEKKVEITNNVFFEQLRDLLESGCHADIVFRLNGNVQVPAHKAILSSRSSYFKAMFREGGMLESSQSDVALAHDAVTFRRLLEFIYTNSVQALKDLDCQELLSLLAMANEFCLQDLQLLCESCLVESINKENVGRLLLFAEERNAVELRKACDSFVRRSKEELLEDGVLKVEVSANPDLGWLLFEAAASGEPDRCSQNIGESSNSKKRR